MQYGRAVDPGYNSRKALKNISGSIEFSDPNPRGNGSGPA